MTLLIVVVAIPLLPPDTTDTYGVRHKRSTTPQRVKKTITDTSILAAIRASDDFSDRQEVFVRGTRAFLSQGGTLADLRQMGGWTRSTSHVTQPIYYTYKKPYNHRSCRVYLDADTGQIFR